MAASIGSFTFKKLTGPQIPALASAIAVIERPGVDGATFTEDAEKATEIRVTTIEWVSTVSVAKTRADDYAAYKGVLKTIVDDIGRSVANVMVLDVRVNSVRRQINTVPSNGDYRVEAVWTLYPTA